MPSLFPPPRVLGSAESGIPISSALRGWLASVGLDEDALEGLMRPRLSQLSAPTHMLGAEAALARLTTALRRGERIVVFGDYDVDGTLSASLLTHMLRRLGADVCVRVAHRFEGGYGFSEPALARVLLDKPSLVVTLDCGTSDHDRFVKLKKAGVDAIVIDHHRVPETPLGVSAFLNPHQPGCQYPLKDLCSAGLAFVLSAALRTRLKAAVDMKFYLPWVALATIADVMPLSHQHGFNRALVKHGLERLSRGIDLPLGLRTMREALTGWHRELTAESRHWVLSSDVAFQWAPRINAAGRLGSAETVVSLMLADDAHEAQALMKTLESLNESRKTIERTHTAEAMALAEQHLATCPQAASLTVWGPWHRGVVGVIAARLVSRFQLPSLVISVDGEEGHGSGRTPEGQDLFLALQGCRDHLRRLGGHAAAVGFSVDCEQLEGLRRAFDAVCGRLRSATESVLGVAPTNQRGQAFECSELLDTEELLWLEPFGNQNAKPHICLNPAKVTQLKRYPSGFFRMRLDFNGRALWCVPMFGTQNITLPDTIDEGAFVQVKGRLSLETWRGGLEKVLELESCAVR